MSDKLTKTFFDTFEIKPELDYFVSFIDDKMKIGRFFHCNKEELIYKHKHTKDKMKVLRVDFDYPQITDRIYLELIRIHFGTRPYDNIGYRENLDKLKEFVLKELTESYKNDFYDFREEVKEKVQALFKENN